MKTNVKQLKAVWQKSRAVLLRYPNVIGVAYGLLETGGKLTGELGLIALVRKKVPVSELSKEQIIPKAIGKYKVNVREPRLTEEAYQKYLKLNGIEVREVDCLMDHFFLDDGKIHEMNLKRRKAEGAEPGDISTAIRGDIFVIEDDGTLVVDGVVDHVAAYNVFRGEFGDHYDFVFFHYDTDSGVPGQGNSSPTIFNDITGINQYKGDAYDDRATWGSTKIQSYQKITGLTQVRRMLHETAHRWCAYVNHQEGGVFSDNLHEEFDDPAQKIYHWGSWFDDDHSCMDYDYYDWVDSATAGEFSQDELNYGEPGTDEFNYHALDLYLMGFLDKSEVGDFRYIQDPTDDDGDGSFEGTEVTLSIDDIIDEEGERSPAYPDTQRVFHQAFVLITNDLAGIGELDDDATTLGNMERYRAAFISAFRQFTNSRGMIDSSLLYDNYSSVYVRDNTADAGGDSSTGAFWDSPDIWVRNNDDGDTTHQDTDSTKDNYIHVRVWNSSGDDYDSVKVRVYVANFAGTEFFFPDDWHPNLLVGEVEIDVAAGSSSIAKVTWPQASIPDATWHPCILVEVLPMEVSPELRHHVWENKKLAQKNISIIYPAEDREPARFEFKFGNKNNLKATQKVLSIVQSLSQPGLRLGLESGGAVLSAYSNPGLTQKLRPIYEQWEKRFGGKDCCDGGLQLTFCEDAKIIVGKHSKMMVTILKGSSFRISDRICCGEEQSGAPAYDGKTYTISQAGIVSYRCTLAGRTLADMTLTLDYSNVSDPQSLRGMISIIQSDEKGRIEGGVNIELRGE